MTFDQTTFYVTPTLITKGNVDRWSIAGDVEEPFLFGRKKKHTMAMLCASVGAAALAVMTVILLGDPLELTVTAAAKNAKYLRVGLSLIPGFFLLHLGLFYFQPRAPLLLSSEPDGGVPVMSLRQTKGICSRQITALDADGTVVATYRKNLLSGLLLTKWSVETADGKIITARQGIVRAFSGPMISKFLDQPNFVIRDSERGRGTFKTVGLKLSLGETEEFAGLDRRVLVALAMVLIVGESYA